MKRILTLTVGISFPLMRTMSFGCGVGPPLLVLHSIVSTTSPTLRSGWDDITDKALEVGNKLPDPSPPDSFGNVKININNSV